MILTDGQDWPQGRWKRLRAATRLEHVPNNLSTEPQVMALVGQCRRKKNGSHERKLLKPRKLCFPNPLNAMRIVVEKDVARILFFTSLLVTIFFCLLVPLSTFLKEIFHFNDLQ